MWKKQGKVISEWGWEEKACLKSWLMSLQELPSSAHHLQQTHSHSADICVAAHSWRRFINMLFVTSTQFTAPCSWLSYVAPLRVCELPPEITEISDMKSLSNTQKHIQQITKVFPSSGSKWSQISYSLRSIIAILQHHWNQMQGC